MVNHPLKATSILAILACLPTSVCAALYRCLDANEKVVYQDRPCQEMTSTRLSPALARMAPAENRQHLFWKLTSDKSTIYLLGSLGFGSDTLYPLPETITDAFAKSQVLVVAPELLNTPRAEADSQAGAANKPATPTPLSAQIKRPVLERLEALASTVGIPEESFLNDKPWQAALTLHERAVKLAGFDSSLTFEKSFIKSAGTAKPIIELDPLDKQIAAIDGLPAVEQEALLVVSLNAADNQAESLKAYAETWKNGDASTAAQATQRAFDSVPNGKNLFERLFIARNEALFNQLLEMAGDGRSYFVIVNAARLSGNRGLLGLFEAKGYTSNQF